MPVNQEGKVSSSNMERRRFFSYLGWALVGLASAGMSWIAGLFLAGNQNPLGLEPSIFGSPGDYSMGIVAKKGRVVLLRDSRGFWAVVTVCPHLGCQPVFLQEQNIFVCPCHGSKFDSEGRVLAGPATENMTLATLRLDAQGALVAYPKEKVRPGYRFG
jgi:cytochrome b6-f complex iron-sulfur subunit